MRKSKVNVLVKIAIMSAVATVLSFIEFPLGIFPDFLKLDISTLPAIITGFALGPLAGVLVEIIKNVLHLFQSMTGGIGELANILIGGTFVFLAATYYKHNKTKKRALISLILGTIGMTIVGVLANYFILLPYYAKVLNFTTEAIVSMAHAINPMVNDLFTFLLMVTAPFNIIKGFILSLITLLIYKKLSPILHR